MPGHSETCGDPVGRLVRVDVSAELSGGQELGERLGKVIQNRGPAVWERRQGIAAWQEATLW